MAQHTLKGGMQYNPVATDRTTGTDAGKTSTSLTTPADYVDHDSCDTRLTAIDPVKYDQSTLDTMNLNDKRFAIRMTDDAADI